MAQAMLVDVGTSRRPDLQNAIQNMMADPPVKLAQNQQQHLRQSKQSVTKSMQSVVEEVDEGDFDRDIGLLPGKNLF